MPADFNPPEVRTPALGWGIRFHFLPHALWNFCVSFLYLAEYVCTLAQCVIASQLHISV